LAAEHGESLPHASLVLERVGTGLEGAIEMAMNFVLPLAALVEERELEKRPDVGAFAGQGDEDGDVGGIVLGILAVGVEVDRPVVTSDGEHVARNVLPHSHPLRQRIALDHELVRPAHRLRQRLRIRRRRQGRSGHAYPNRNSRVHAMWRRGRDFSES